VEHVRTVGFEAFLDEQFAEAASGYPTLPLYPTTRDTTTCPNNSACQRDNYTMYPLQKRFFVNALYGQDQLRQRVAFALHQIIVVSGVDITQPSWMTPYLQILDRNAFGNYRQLLFEITLNPAMGNYLDVNGNTRTRPNENYARELLQLFSIGTVRLNVDGTQQLDGHRPADHHLHAGNGERLRAGVYGVAIRDRASDRGAQLHRSDGGQRAAARYGGQDVAQRPAAAPGPEREEGSGRRDR
jgi:uncharacterized protein (DUF1800 family)